MEESPEDFRRAAGTQERSGYFKQGTRVGVTAGQVGNGLGVDQAALPGLQPAPHWGLGHEIPPGEDRGMNAEA
jgi:hypothetical protein